MRLLYLLNCRDFAYLHCVGKSRLNELVLVSDWSYPNLRFIPAFNFWVVVCSYWWLRLLRFLFSNSKPYLTFDHTVLLHYKGRAAIVLDEDFTVSQSNNVKPFVEEVFRSLCNFLV